MPVILHKLAIVLITLGLVARLYVFESNQNVETSGWWLVSMTLITAGLIVVIYDITLVLALKQLRGTYDFVS